MTFSSEAIDIDAIKNIILNMSYVFVQRRFCLWKVSNGSTGSQHRGAFLTDRMTLRPCCMLQFLIAALREASGSSTMHLLPHCFADESCLQHARVYVTCVYVTCVYVTCVYAAFPPCDDRVTQAHLSVCVCAWVPPCFAADEERRTPPTVTPQMLSYLHICRTNSQVFFLFLLPKSTLPRPPPTTISPMCRPAPRPHYWWWKASVETNAAIILLLALTNTTPHFSLSLALSLSLSHTHSSLSLPLSHSLCLTHTLSLSLSVLGIAAFGCLQQCRGSWIHRHEHEGGKTERVYCAILSLLSSDIWMTVYMQNNYLLNGWISTTVHKMMKPCAAGS